MTNQKPVNELIDNLFQRDDIHIITKDQGLAFWKILDNILKIVSLGKMNNFLTHYTTTIGNVIAFPRGWKREDASAIDYVTLKHELVHVKQCRLCGLGHVWLGALIMGLLYLLVPLPLGLAWFRYKFERDAYKVSYYTAKKVGLKPNLSFYIDVLSGPDYLWAWIFKGQVKRWFLSNCN